MTDRITLAPDDAAKVLGIGASTLQDWTRRGIVPSIKIGGVRLYSLRALERWAEEASRYEEAGRGETTGAVPATERQVASRGAGGPRKSGASRPRVSLGLLPGGSEGKAG